MEFMTAVDVQLRTSLQFCTCWEMLLERISSQRTPLTETCKKDFVRALAAKIGIRAATRYDDLRSAPESKPGASTGVAQGSAGQNSTPPPLQRIKAKP